MSVLHEDFVANLHVASMRIKEDGTIYEGFIPARYRVLDIGVSSIVRESGSYRSIFIGGRADPLRTSKECWIVAPQQSRIVIRKYARVFSSELESKCGFDESLARFAADGAVPCASSCSYSSAAIQTIIVDGGIAAFAALVVLLGLVISARQLYVTLLDKRQLCRYCYYPVVAAVQRCPECGKLYGANNQIRGRWPGQG